MLIGSSAWFRPTVRHRSKTVATGRLRPGHQTQPARDPGTPPPRAEPAPARPAQNRDSTTHRRRRPTGDCLTAGRVQSPRGSVWPTTKGIARKRIEPQGLPQGIPMMPKRCRGGKVGGRCGGRLLPEAIRQLINQRIIHLERVCVSGCHAPLISRLRCAARR